MKSILSDLIILLGVSAVTYGTHEIYPPAGYICGGLFAIAIGVIIAMNIANDQPDPSINQVKPFRNCG